MTVVESVSKPSQQAETARELTACLTESLAGAPRRAEREGRWHVSLRRRLILGGASAGRRWTKTEATALCQAFGTPQKSRKNSAAKISIFKLSGGVSGTICDHFARPGRTESVATYLAPSWCEVAHKAQRQVRARFFLLKGENMQHAPRVRPRKVHRRRPSY